MTEEGTEDSLLEWTPAEFSVVHWHNDMPGLTKEATILASSKGCPRQIIRYLPFVYGFQCHPEATRANIEEMIQHCSCDLNPEIFIQSAEEILTYDLDEANQVLIGFMNRFVSLHKKSAVNNLS